MEDNKKKGLGMVLEGGGMRGLYTAGVLDELMEQGIYAEFYSWRFRRCNFWM